MALKTYRRTVATHPVTRSFQDDVLHICQVSATRFGASDPPEVTVIAQFLNGRFTTMTYVRRNRAGSIDLFGPASLP